LLNEDGENITIMYDEVFIDVGASFEKTDLEFWREENRTLEKKE
jgi:hypothetical protein